MWIIFLDVWIILIGIYAGDGDGKGRNPQLIPSSDLHIVPLNGIMLVLWATQCYQHVVNLSSIESSPPKHWI